MVVTAPKRTSACGRQAVRRPLGELRIRLPELRLEERGRLQVMAQYFVELDEALAVPFEPAGETLVKLGAGDLGEGVVGGVADEDVAKAEGVLTGEEWLLPLDEVLPHERGQERRDLIPLSERLNGLAMHTSRIGASAESSATCSTRSSSVSSAQCRSSITTASGARSSSSLRNAQAISSAEVGASSSPSSVAIAAAAAGSDGRAPSCFSTSTTGQYVIPSPYDKQRPRTIRASISARPWATRRDLPTPASPTTVMSWQGGSKLPPSHASRSMRSSRERPTKALS